MDTNPLLNSLYKEPGESLLQTVMAHLEDGHDPNTASSHGVIPIRVALRRKRMDVFSLLIEHGADIAPMGWSALHQAVALGTLEEVRALLPQSDMSVRDRDRLTPFLLAVYIGDVTKAAVLLPMSSREDTHSTYKHEPALVVATEWGSAEMVEWLLANGFDPNDEAEFGRTALISAASEDAPEFVAMLLKAGARIDAKDDITASLRKRNPNKGDGDFPGYYDVETFQTASSETSSTNVARLLMKAGVDLNEFSPSVLRGFIGSGLVQKQQITPEIFHAQKHRRFGTYNPEPVAYEYWLEAIRRNTSGWVGRKEFLNKDCSPPAIWSHDRFGMSTTELPDGRWVQIAGEHEDSYDCDFCIYSDVFVFDGTGNVQIYIYPREVFPPTDFHTATLCGDEIIVIGNLGYGADRQPGSTQVMRLSLDDFSISRIETSGAMPGWISGHRARLYDGKITVWDGEILKDSGFVPNKVSFQLCLASGVWTKLV